MKLLKKHLWIWQSSEFVHPETTGSNKVIYYFNHNQEKRPIMQSIVDCGSYSGALWYNYHLVENGGTGYGITYYGCQNFSYISSINTTVIYIYKLTSGNSNIKVNLFFESW